MNPSPIPMPGQILPPGKMGPNPAGPLPNPSPIPMPGQITPPVVVVPPVNRGPYYPNPSPIPLPTPGTNNPVVPPKSPHKLIKIRLIKELLMPINEQIFNVETMLHIKKLNKL